VDKDCSHDNSVHPEKHSAITTKIKGTTALDASPSQYVLDVTTAPEMDAIYDLAYLNGVCINAALCGIVKSSSMIEKSSSRWTPTLR
jgi:hypothetical protein